MGAKRKLLILLAAASAIAALTASTLASRSQASSGSHSAVSFAAGGYVAQVPGFTDVRRFAFNVIRLPDGTVVGDAFNHSPVQHRDIHVSLNCFAREGNQAIVGGIVTQSSDPAAIGLAGAFAIQDDLDAISFFLNNGPGGVPPITCANLLEQAGEQTITGLLADFGVPFQQAVVFLRP